MTARGHDVIGAMDPGRGFYLRFGRCPPGRNPTPLFNGFAYSSTRIRACQKPRRGDPGADSGRYFPGHSRPATSARICGNWRWPRIHAIGMSLPEHDVSCHARPRRWSCVCPVCGCCVADRGDVAMRNVDPGTNDDGRAKRKRPSIQLALNKERAGLNNQHTRVVAQV